MIGFYGHTNESGEINATCFSNFYPAPFTYQGWEFSTSEQALMASKAMLFWDHARFNMIVQADTPALAKRYGRQIENYDDTIWSAVRLEIMTKILHAKFEQNPELCEYLKSTNGLTLVEVSPTDKIWGVGLSLNDDAWKNPANWQGENLLGRALMRARQLINCGARSY